VIPGPGDACAGQRQGDEQTEDAYLGVHFPPDLKGQRPGCPSPVRELMALSHAVHETPRKREGRPSFWERPSHALPDRKDTAAGVTLVGQGWPAVSNDR
jgi:hypothetical protein